MVIVYVCLYEFRGREVRWGNSDDGLCNEGVVRSLPNASWFELRKKKKKKSRGKKIELDRWITSIVK